MRLERRQIAIDGDQTVSVVVAFPSKAAPGGTTAVILAHGAGNDMHTPFLSAVQEGLAVHGCVSVKFNFPYTELGRRRPDPAPVLEACYARVIASIREDPQIAPARIVIGGKSMGGRMASHLTAKGEAVDGLILLGYPLHPAGKVEQLRTAHLHKIHVPMLFFAGTRDPLSRLDLLKEALAGLSAPIELHVIEGGDHSFKVPKALHRDAAAVWEEIVDTSARWLGKLVD